MEITWELQFKLNLCLNWSELLLCPRPSNKQIKKQIPNKNEKQHKKGREEGRQEGGKEGRQNIREKIFSISNKTHEPQFKLNLCLNWGER